MAIGSRYSRSARIVATVSAAAALGCGISSVAAPSAAAIEVASASGLSPSLRAPVEDGAKDPASRPTSAAKGMASQARYQCITRNNTPLYFGGAIINWANAGQGLYDVMDFGYQRISARLWGGGDTSYKIDRWNVGWCG